MKKALVEIEHFSPAVLAIGICNLPIFFFVLEHVTCLQACMWIFGVWLIWEDGWLGTTVTRAMRNQRLPRRFGCTQF